MVLVLGGSDLATDLGAGDTGLRDEVGRLVALGFPGKLAIGPAQVEASNAALTSSDTEVDKARAVLANAEQGSGGQTVEECVARKARHTLATAGVTLT